MWTLIAIIILSIICLILVFDNYKKAKQIGYLKALIEQNVLEHAVSMIQKRMDNMNKINKDDK